MWRLLALSNPRQPVPIRIDGFDGPFDLLLRLIERHELDLTTIALTAVTDQYLVHLGDVRNADQLTAFLVVAAQLLLIKSTALLPRPPRVSPTELPADPTNLTARLERYRRFQKLSQWLADRQEHRRSYPRPPVPYTPGPAPLPRFDPADLCRAYLRARSRLKRQLPTAAMPLEELSIADALASLERAFHQRTSWLMSDLVPPEASRRLLVVTFLALLELIRIGQVQASQDGPFGPIVAQRSMVE